MATGSQLDLQLSRILDRRRLAVEEPDRYGSTPLLTSRSSLSTVRSEINNLPTALRNFAARRQSAPASQLQPRPPSNGKLRQVAAGVKVLQAGQPTLSTQLIAAAEDARTWLISFPGLCEAVEIATEAAAQRAPQAVSDIANAASQWILCELRESRVAVKAFSRPEVLLLEAPASHCPATPRDALDRIMTALQRGRPCVTVRIATRAEHARQNVLGAWKVAERLGRDLFTSRVACFVAQKMEECAAIADVYDHKNPRILSDEHVKPN